MMLSEARRRVNTKSLMRAKRNHLLREAREGDETMFIFKRISMSQLTDEQMEKCPNVARGAEYVYEVAMH